MPEGILPELLIVLAFVLIIAGVVVTTRRRPPREGVATKDDLKAVESAVETKAEPERPTGEVVDTPSPVTVEPVRRPSLRERLGKSRKFLGDRLSDALHGAPDDDTWDDVEAALIQADIGVGAATEIVKDLRTKARERKLTNAADVRSLLGEQLVELFEADRDRALGFATDGPTVWLVVGVNGTGKTTTIGKLARDLSERGRSVALAAADTFRAAADEQLGIWADRTGAELIKHQPGADPGAVAYDALQHVRARGMDVLIVDTAGRLHTKTPLMDELGKVRRVIEKESRVQESLLVIDATAGQNGLVQAREFAEATGVTGIVLTKLDGTAKGGIALAIERELGIPIKLIGVGEGLEDLEPFDPKTYVDALLT